MLSGNKERAISLDDCQYLRVSPSEPLSATDLLSYFGQIRTYVQHEDSLINSRLVWSFTVHGFLFAVYGVLWNHVIELFVRLNTTLAKYSENVALHSSDPAISRVIFLVLVAQIPIAILGALVGYQSHNAIEAAHCAIEHLNAIAEASLKMNSNGSDGMLLPRITNGGATVVRTDSSRLYPVGAIFVWIGLALISIAAAFFALHNNPA
jgi:hypothetical protein